MKESIVLSILFIIHYKTQSNSVLNLSLEYGYKSACGYQSFDCFLRRFTNFLLYFRMSIFLEVGGSLWQPYLQEGETLYKKMVVRPIFTENNLIAAQ